MTRKKADKPSAKERLNLGSKVELEDPAGSEQAPTLYDIMRPRFKDGKCTRQGASLNLRVIGGCYVVRISCPSEEVQTTFTIGSLALILGDLESGVRSSSTVWLPDYESQKRARREAEG